jgi:heme oxygenase (mycobilin-producing)
MRPRGARRKCMQTQSGVREPVVLINAFSVPIGRENDFLALWNKAAGLLTDKPGFIDSRLHRSLAPDSHFRFINFARWESPEAFQAAVALPEFQELEKEWPYEHVRGLYRVDTQL